MLLWLLLVEKILNKCLYINGTVQYFMFIVVSTSLLYLLLEKGWYSMHGGSFTSVTKSIIVGV